MGLGRARLLEELPAEAGIQRAPSTSLDSRFRGNDVIWGFLPADEAPETQRWLRVSEHLRKHLAVLARPLTPNPSPALGRGEPKSVELSSDESIVTSR